MSVDINSPEFARQFIKIIDKRIDERFKELLKDVVLEKTGAVATAGNGKTISIYIENSTTAVEVKNPRSFSLTEGQLVKIVFPNFKNDNTKYIDRVL